MISARASFIRKRTKNEMWKMKGDSCGILAGYFVSILVKLKTLIIISMFTTILVWQHYQQLKDTRKQTTVKKRAEERIQVAYEQYGNQSKISDRIEYRKKWLNSVCKMSKFPLPQKAMRSCTHCNIYVLKKKVAYCQIRKVATSTIATDLVKIENLHSTKNAMLYKIIDDNIPRITPKAYLNGSKQYKNYKTFMFVRHPFARLASAFKDKADCDPLLPRAIVFYRQHFWKAIKKYRPGTVVKNHTRITFREFIKMILDTPFHLHNTHWVPFWFTCEPCSMNYDYIGKIETFAEDKNYIYNQLFFGMKFAEKSEIVNQKKSELDHQRYFSQLTKNELDALYIKYKLDFDLFGYSPDYFYKFIK